MGGTFDPIHHGHLVAASEVAAKFGLDEVVFVPTGQPWQKSSKKVSEPEHRYLMTVIATASNPRAAKTEVPVPRRAVGCAAWLVTTHAAWRSSVEGRWPRRSSPG